MWNARVGHLNMIGYLYENLLFSHGNKRKREMRLQGGGKTLLPNQSSNRSCSMECWASFILRLQHPRNHFQRSPVWLAVHQTGTKEAQERNTACVFGYDGCIDNFWYIGIHQLYTAVSEPLFIFYLLSLTYKQTIIYLWISVSSVCVDVAWECRSILLGWPCDFPVAEQLKHNCRAFHSAIAAYFHFIVRTMGQSCVAD